MTAAAAGSQRTLPSGETPGYHVQGANIPCGRIPHFDFQIRLKMGFGLRTRNVWKLMWVRIVLNICAHEPEVTRADLFRKRSGAQTLFFWVSWLLVGHRNGVSTTALIPPFEHGVSTIILSRASGVLHTFWCLAMLQLDDDLLHIRILDIVWCHHQCLWSTTSAFGGHGWIQFRENSFLGSGPINANKFDNYMKSTSACRK